MNPVPAASSETALISVRRAARAGSKWSSSATTRIRIAILPIVWPHAAVNAPKYDNFNNARNATIGTGGSSAHSSSDSADMRNVE